MRVPIIGTPIFFVIIFSYHLSPVKLQKKGGSESKEIIVPLFVLGTITKSASTVSVVTSSFGSSPYTITNLIYGRNSQGGSFYHTYSITCSPINGKHIYMRFRPYMNQNRSTNNENIKLTADGGYSNTIWSFTGGNSLIDYDIDISGLRNVVITLAGTLYSNDYVGIYMDVINSYYIS